jgi:hypothetical protein
MIGQMNFQASLRVVTFANYVRPVSIPESWLFCQPFRLCILEKKHYNAQILFV